VSVGDLFLLARHLVNLGIVGVQHNAHTMNMCQR
jgi:hypothetical protein